MQIRRAEHSDIAAIAALEQLCFPDPWSTKGLRDTMQEERACFLAAEEDGLLCGYVNATWVLDEMNLNRICVHPDWRRRRIGHLLLENLRQFCLENQITHIFLEVRESNEAARRLYQAEGFEQLGKRPRFYTAPVEDAVLMEYLVK